MIFKYFFLNIYIFIFQIKKNIYIYFSFFFFFFCPILCNKPLTVETWAGAWRVILAIYHFLDLFSETILPGASSAIGFVKFSGKDIQTWEKMEENMQLSLDKLPIKRLDAIEENGLERFPAYASFSCLVFLCISLTFSWNVGKSFDTSPIYGVKYENSTSLTINYILYLNHWLILRFPVLLSAFLLCKFTASNILRWDGFYSLSCCNCNWYLLTITSYRLLC